MELVVGVGAAVAALVQHLQHAVLILEGIQVLSIAKDLGVCVEGQ